jgi:putative SOS response-associated peptidase YedK
MCGRIVITSAPEALRQLFGYIEQPNFPPRYNVAPTQPIPVVVFENGVRHFRLMRWGLIPAWVKDPREFTLLINARSETVTEKPAFKNAIRRRRCLVPADGYYEWTTTGKHKQPYFIHPGDGVPVGFAAVAETWVGPNGEEVDTVAIITTAASSAMAMLHDRVPVTIAPEDYARWLDCSEDNAGPIMTLLEAPPDGQFGWHPVGSDVNRVANDNAQLVLPISEADVSAAARRQPQKRAPARKQGEPDGDGGQGSLF